MRWLLVLGILCACDNKASEYAKQVYGPSVKCEDLRTSTGCGSVTDDHAICNTGREILQCIYSTRSGGDCKKIRDVPPEEQTRMCERCK